MSNLIFPALDGLKPTTGRTAIWKTTVKESASGMELRGTQVSSPRYRYNLTYEVLRENYGYTDLQQIVGLFNNCRGSWDNFLYLDPDDNSVTDQQFGIGDGVTTQFQLVRNYGSFIEPIAAISGAPVIKKNGVVQATPGAYTVSAEGLVSFVLPPAAGHVLLWSGAYYWRCRFTRDELEYDRFLEDLFEARRVEFITVKGEFA